MKISTNRNINCPPYYLMTQYHSSRAGPHDSLTTRTDDTMHCASTRTCPSLDPSSSMDSLQTHDSLITPESPQSPYAPSPCDSLASGKHHLSFCTFSHLIIDIRQDKTEPTYYMSYHIKHRIFLKKFCIMSKNKTENAVIKSLILLHLSKKLLMCEKVRKLK